ncbi:hypothetical protein [Maritalea mediterranea]|uniref:DUF3035 domain-containing protein n=1 Tax=Maritalea mediterranea TaxID=2909667 RepID=A0ABS9E4P7_9HYPH|nr:hypothetical protein [Maritalea mediterranea]MCF4097772.1 hypothetical protein [Maritalea mediterranea]
MFGTNQKFPTIAKWTGIGTLVSASLLGLSACTTVEGTNAFKDGNTFEREVMSETLRGLGILEREEKEDISAPRAPLVLPKDTKFLPIPTKTAAAALPKDSDEVLLDETRLTENEIRLIRGARVVDLNDATGRAFTPKEAKEVARRFREQRIAYQQALRDGGRRPLYLPPEKYFTKVGGQDLICLAENGDLVPLDSPLCPPEIREALQGS